MKFQISNIDYSAKFKMAGAVVATSVFLGLLFFVGITSCKKDTPLIPEQLETPSNENTSGSITFRDASMPTVINGILTFPSYKDAKDYAKSLESSEQDHAQLNSAYA